MKKSASKKDTKKKKTTKARVKEAPKKAPKLKPAKEEKKPLKGVLNEEEEFDDLLDPEDLKLDDFSADGLEDVDDADGFYEDEF